ncbi:hypothetical protein [Allokutzneria albata]|uniref:Uncharacterized protein n=1 Tax=Allokutzneria albata TaxID=211114 RepID=A0A1H0A4H0_ALLAB|nr:hypothetical protein [Allokutzneria albata]SDN28559.1 hypothetical protein SAMN04489726_5880 [Allokutzneria albata]
MNLDDELRRMFQDERISLTPSPVAGRAIVAGARRRRRNRRGLAVGGGAIVAVLAVVGGVAASSVGLAAKTPLAQSGTPSVTTPAKQPLPTVLGPNGLGALRLGMTRQQAHETGMVSQDVLDQQQAAEHRCTRHELLDSSGTSFGTVVVSRKAGLAEVLPRNAPRTPEGLRAGMTVEQAGNVYPELRKVALSSGSGSAQTPVPGNSRAVFTVDFNHSKVTAISLRFNDNDESCSG